VKVSLDYTVYIWVHLHPEIHIFQKKGTKAVTGAVPFQKVNFFSVLSANMYILSVNIYILGAIMYILGVNMYILGANMYILSVNIYILGVNMYILVANMYILGFL